MSSPKRNDENGILHLVSGAKDKAKSTKDEQKYKRKIRALLL